MSKAGRHHQSYCTMYICMKRIIFFLFLSVTFLSSCNEDTAYSKYADIAIAGWECSDSVYFDIPPLKSSGDYTLNLGLRITSDFPFKNIYIIAEQTVYPQKTIYCDTIDCKLFDERGRVLGNGISTFQYLFHVAKRHYQQNDSIHIYIRHNMKREIMPGLTSVGIELTKQ